MPIPERPVLVAPDSFKGTFSAAQVAGAIGRGIERAGLMPPDLCPVADGGEGTLDALLPQLGGELLAVTVKGPLGAEVRTGFGLVEDGGTAIVEMAMASGLGLMPEQDAWNASTYGTGQLIAAAAQAGAGVILDAVGGSATTDGGAGAIEAIEAAGGIGRTKTFGASSNGVRTSQSTTIFVRPIPPAASIASIAPAPPSVVAEPPTATRITPAPACAAAAINWPVP